MFKKIRWNFILTLSVITTIIFVVGYFSALSLTINPPKTKTHKKLPVTKQNITIPKVSTSNYNILVLGDSIAKGTGDEKGLGFGNYFADSIKTKTSKPIVLNNLAINGDVSAGLLRILKNVENSNYVKNSDIIFISIGGNEITRFKNSDLISADTKLKQVQNTYTNNIKNILKIIRTSNSTCPIAFIGLYNPFGKNVTSDKVTFLNSWNYNTEQLISKDSNTLFIPTYDLFKYNLDKYLTVDNFHPNSTGYKAIAARLLEALSNRIK